MNELFNNGDYVLLEDCKAFDEKFGLENGATMWAVARKMEGGEPIKRSMSTYAYDKCVGVNDGDTGLWRGLTEKDYSTKLSVKDVLYRSKDGLTLDELSEIHGAFEEGRRYECVYSGTHLFNKGDIYTANGDGILDDGGESIGSGDLSKFKPVTKAEWLPSVGDEVMYFYKSDRNKKRKVKVLAVNRNRIWLQFLDLDLSDNLFELSKVGFEPIDQKRERVISEALTLSVAIRGELSHEEFCERLYDAGMLKEGDK